MSRQHLEYTGEMGRSRTACGAAAMGRRTREPSDVTCAQCMSTNPPRDVSAGTFVSDLAAPEPTLESIREAMSAIQAVPHSVQVDGQLLGLAIQNMRLRDELSLLRDELRAVRALVICGEHDDCKANPELARACAASPRRSSGG